MRDLEIDKFEKKVVYFWGSISLFGSILMLTVYFQPSMRGRLSMSIYFRGMAFMCAAKVVYEIILVEYAYPRLQNSYFAYKLVAFLSTMFAPITVWLQVMANFDRFLVILFPSRFSFLRGTFAQRFIVAIIVVYNMIYQICNLTSLSIFNRKPDEYFRTYVVFNLLNCPIVPSIILIALSVAILVGIVKTRRHFKSSKPNPIVKRKSLKDIKFGVTMIALNISLLSFYGVWRAYYAIVDQDMFEYLQDSRISLYLRCFGLVIKKINEAYFSTIFFVQLLVNNIVRKELWKMLTNIWSCISGRLAGIFNRFSSSSSSYNTTSQEPPIQASI